MLSAEWALTWLIEGLDRRSAAPGCQSGGSAPGDTVNAPVPEQRCGRLTSTSNFVPGLAALSNVPSDLVEGYLADLEASTDFLDALNASVDDVPEFEGVHFTKVDDLRLYRCLLYVLVRVTQAETFVETGTLNGFSSAFILLGMHHNGGGTLYSIDLPSLDSRLLSQGTAQLPEGKEPGWVIPQFLRSRHQLLLGPAQVVLPEVAGRLGELDVFLHDSDHSYPHMMFEMAFAWLHLRPGGVLVCDNVEQHDGFYDFARGVGLEPFVAASFDSPERTWKHGVLRKPITIGPGA
jgi:predicted O-methyltransferase YrrM